MVSPLPTLYHGTLQPLERFDAQAAAPELQDGEGVWGHARGLGTFFSVDPKIAAHFTLKAEVLDAGFDSHQGSVSLVNNPWQFDADPFLPGAQVLACQAPTGLNLASVPVLAWVAQCEEWDEEVWQEWKTRLQAQGFDGVEIPAWDGQQTHPDYGSPCVEYHATTYALFDPRPVTIVDRQPAQALWDNSPRPRLRP